MPIFAAGGVMNRELAALAFDALRNDRVQRLPLTGTIGARYLVRLGGLVTVAPWCHASGAGVALVLVSSLMVCLPFIRTVGGQLNPSCQVVCGRGFTPSLHETF